MTHLASHFPNLPGHSPLVGFAARVLHILAWPGRVLAARRTFVQLAGMSPRELSDIGLSQQDLVDFTARPLDEDPSELMVRARSARARLAMSRGGRI